MPLIEDHHPMILQRVLNNNFRGNLTGGLTAGIVALPLALAFGISSGAGPIAGIYGAIIVGLFASVFGGTASQISGPTGPMTVVMTAMVSQYSITHPETALALAFSTVMLGGSLQILFGVLRLGKYIVMVPYPVISGFMSGIGVIIILLEIAPLLGHETTSTAIDTIMRIPILIRTLNIDAVVIGIGTLTIVFLWKGKWNRMIPAPLLALAVITCALNLIAPDSSADRIGSIPSALPNFQFPVFKLDIFQEIFKNALILAVLGSIDSLLTSLVADNITGTQHDSNRELIGQGIGNTVSGLMGGLPGAGATMRTVINIRAGGSGSTSGITHAIFLFLMVIGFGFLMESIPLAALAGILIKVGIDIIDWPFIKRIHRLPLFPVALMTLVLLLTVFADLITAVFIGVFIKNIVTISKISDLQLGSVTLSDGSLNNENLSKRERKALEKHCGNVVLFRISGPLSYAVGRGLSTRFKSFLDRKSLIIDLSQASIIGISTSLALEEIINKAKANNMEVKLVGVGGDKPEELQKLDLFDLVGKENCIDTVELALASVSL